MNTIFDHFKNILTSERTFYLTLLILISINITVMAQFQCVCKDTLVFVHEQYDSLERLDNGYFGSSENFNYYIFYGIDADEYAKMNIKNRFKFWKKREENIAMLMDLQKIVGLFLPEDYVNCGYFGITLYHWHREDYLKELKKWEQKYNKEGICKDSDTTHKPPKLWKFDYLINLYDRYFTDSYPCDRIELFSCLFLCKDFRDKPKLLALLKTDIDTISGLKTMPFEELTVSNLDNLLNAWKLTLCK